MFVYVECLSLSGWIYYAWFSFLFFFFKQKTAYEMLRSLVGSEMCIRDSVYGVNTGYGKSCGNRIDMKAVIKNAPNILRFHGLSLIHI